jgi:hypothetical protein
MMIGRCDANCDQPSPSELSPSADVAGVRQVPVQMWQAWAKSQCRCGRRGPSPSADVAGVPVPAQMRRGWAQSRRRCGRRGPSLRADVAGVGPVSAQMWQAWAQSQCRCGRRGPSLSADVAGVGPVPAQLWVGQMWQKWSVPGRASPSASGAPPARRRRSPAGAARANADGRSSDGTVLTRLHSSYP